jgi:hypothetical protein
VVADAKVMGAAFLRANGFSREIIDAFLDIQTPYPTRALMLVEDIAKEGSISPSAGVGVVGRVVAKHLKRDIDFYFHDLIDYNTIVEAVDDEWRKKLNVWLCAVRNGLRSPDCCFDRRVAPKAQCLAVRCSQRSTLP